MLLAYVSFPVTDGHTISLSLVAGKRDEPATAIRIDLLFQSEAAVFWIGGDDAITVKELPEEKAKIISAVHPAKIFLTPDTPTSPGIVAIKVKIIDNGHGRYETFFTGQQNIGAKWQSWRPCDLE